MLPFIADYNSNLDASTTIKKSQVEAHYTYSPTLYEEELLDLTEYQNDHYSSIFTSLGDEPDMFFIDNDLIDFMDINLSAVSDLKINFRKKVKVKFKIVPFKPRIIID